LSFEVVEATLAIAVRGKNALNGNDLSKYGRIMKFNPNDLLLFASVIAEGSFSKAAERLDLPNSTISRRIADLERNLGEKLLIRTTRKMTVTDFGYAVLRHAQQIAAEIDATIVLSDTRRAVPTGQLRISMPGDFTNNMMGPMLAGFILEYPEVTLDIHVSQRRVDVIGESFDVVIRIGELASDATLVAKSIGSFSVGLYAAPAYLKRCGCPEKPEDLIKHHGLMLCPQGAAPKSWELTNFNNDEWGGMPNVVAVSNSPSVLANLALSGVGITTLASHYARQYVNDGKLLRILPEWSCPTIPVWAVFPERRLMPTRTRVFLDYIANSFNGFDSI
jgi:Transcriptional regulator